MCVSVSLGFVTNHVNLLQDQSKLYHYLATLEMDPKRSLAMELRRADLLRDVLTQISRSAFDTLHKQISYELGEIYLECLEKKLAKVRDRQTHGHYDDDAAAAAAASLKGKELQNCNEYCRAALASFSHFCNMYAKNTAKDAHGKLFNPPPAVRSDVRSNSQAPLLDQPLSVLMTALCLDPDYGERW